MGAREGNPRDFLSSMWQAVRQYVGNDTAPSRAHHFRRWACQCPQHPCCSKTCFFFVILIVQPAASGQWNFTRCRFACSIAQTAEEIWAQEAVQMQVVRCAVRHGRRIGRSPEGAHWAEAVLLSHMSCGVCFSREPTNTHEDPPQTSSVSVPALRQGVFEAVIPFRAHACAQRPEAVHLQDVSPPVCPF